MYWYLVVPHVHTSPYDNRHIPEHGKFAHANRPKSFTTF